MPLFSQENESLGEESIAWRYTAMAETAFREKRFPQAEALLTRASDYASVSSDISYLLAAVKRELGRPVRETLTAARLALETDRWKLYSRQDALYLEVETLIHLRMYNEALKTLSLLDENERSAELRIFALRYLAGNGNFDSAVVEAFERYPRNAVFPRILFQRAAEQNIPDEKERVLVDTALKRLPALLNVDGGLIRYAAPFISNKDDARRLLASWRLTAPADRRSAGLLIEALPICLETGLIDEETAMNELFHVSVPSVENPPEIDRGVLVQVWELLRTDGARETFRSRLDSFSGVITGDETGDGVIDSWAAYINGVIVSYMRDADQDGLSEIAIIFDSGWPANAELLYTGVTETSGSGKIALVWEKYPALCYAVFGDTKFFFRPAEFNYQLVNFEMLGGTGGIWLPETGTRNGTFTGHLTLSYAYQIERQGMDFPGSIERIECVNGIISSAKEYLDGRVVSETAYESGIPIFQRIDLDLDGRLETVRRFKPTANGGAPSAGTAWVFNKVLPFEIEVAESDWDGDGLIEYSEIR
ncbi:MAG: hypothetical protein LBB22_00700 [Treponema sp.]|nr:hypothetical protein [Treponema sp.]